MDNETKQIFETILGKLDHMDGKLEQIDGRLDRIDTRLDSMDTRLDNMDMRLDSMDTRLDGMDIRLDHMDEKIDSNHVEVMTKLNMLENNQEAIKKYIFNADEAFKIVEKDHKFIENLKKAIGE